MTTTNKTYIVVSSDLTTVTVVYGEKETTGTMDYKHGEQAHHEMAELCCHSYPDCDIIVLDPTSAIRRKISLQDLNDLCVLAEFGY